MDVGDRSKTTLLDREVAFALIKTEGLDEVSRTCITREAQVRPSCLLLRHQYREQKFKKEKDG